MGPDVCRNSCTSAYNSALATVCFCPGSTIRRWRSMPRPKCPNYKGEYEGLCYGNLRWHPHQRKTGRHPPFLYQPTGHQLLRANTSPCSGNHTPHPICLLCVIIQVTEPSCRRMAPAGHTHTACVSKKGSGNHRRDKCHGSLLLGRE